jgi:hypothetical protein
MHPYTLDRHADAHWHTIAALGVITSTRRCPRRRRLSSIAAALLGARP